MQAQPNPTRELEVVPYAPSKVGVPSEWPVYWELLKARQILLERGLCGDAYGDWGKQRCLVGALVESVGSKLGGPRRSHDPDGEASARYQELYAVVLSALPSRGGGRPWASVEAYSDHVCATHEDPHEVIAELLDRVAFSL